MKVMWILGRTPTDAAREIGMAPVSGGSWQDALLESMRAEPGIQLLVAFPGPHCGRRTVIRGVEFAEIGSVEPAGRIAKVVGRWQMQGVENAVIDECGRLADDWGADLIHLHGTESGLGLVAGRVDIPVIVSIQGLLTVWVESDAHDFRPPYIPNFSWPSDFARGITPWHHTRRLRAAAEVERRVLRMCRCVAGRTSFDARVTGVLAPQTSYVHVGEAMRDAFHGPQWEGRQGQRVRTLVLCAGASGLGFSYSRKGVDTAIEAVRILAESGVETRLRIYGAAPESKSGRLAIAHARRLGIPEMIHLPGPLNADEVVAELLAADVYLHPSRVDNSPNALCEAMMLGVPCVASTAGGIPSLASDGADALLVPPADAYSLAGAVRSLLADGALAASLSAAARARAAARHDPVTIRDQLLAAYATTLATPAAGVPRRDCGASSPPSSEEPAVFGR